MLSLYEQSSRHQVNSDLYFTQPFWKKGVFASPMGLMQTKTSMVVLAVRYNYKNVPYSSQAGSMVEPAGLPQFFPVDQGWERPYN